MSLHHRVRRSTFADKPAPLIVMLHGFGSNEADLIGLAPYFDPHFTVVSARAPYTLAQGSYAWFELEFSRQGQVIGRNMQQADNSRAIIAEFIASTVNEYKADPKQVFLMGFSQGAMMSAYVALTQPELLAGVVLMSGSVLPDWQPTPSAAHAIHHLPIIMVHGTEDTVLPIQHGRDSQKILASLGVPLEYHEYDMGHTISEESLADIDLWLNNQSKTVG